MKFQKWITSTYSCTPESDVWICLVSKCALIPWWPQKVIYVLITMVNQGSWHLPLTSPPALRNLTPTLSLRHLSLPTALSRYFWFSLLLSLPTAGLWPPLCSASVFCLFWPEHSKWPVGPASTECLTPTFMGLDVWHSLIVATVPRLLISPPCWMQPLTIT